MFVYRGEKFKEEGYLTDAKEQHTERINMGLSICENALEVNEKEREKILVTRKEDIERYEILVEKPLVELSMEEKISIVETSNRFFRMADADVIDLNQPLTDEMVQIARSTLQLSLNSPLKDIEAKIEFYKEKIENLKTAESKTFFIALDRNSITKENIEILKNNIAELIKDKAYIHVAIDGDMKLKSNDSETDYLYSKDELELLNDLDTFLISNNINSLKICERQRLTDLDDLKDAWTLDQVITANTKIDKIVNNIKSYNLSPFETILYIHKIVSSFKYNGDDKLEVPRVLPSILTSNKIVCSGYASLVKAIVDKLDIPELKCDLVGCNIIKKGMAYGHTHNIVKISYARCCCGTGNGGRFVTVYA